MKQLKRGKILVSIFLVGMCMNVSAQAPFSRGVNFTNWFQAPSASKIQFSKFTIKDFENVKSLGCDVVRLPINLHFMTNGKPDYKLDPAFFSYLDQVVTWAEQLHIHLILDNHTFDPAVGTDPKIGDVLVKVWSQMAKHYKDRSALIYYELLNEPHGIDDAVWQPIQQSVIDAVRKEDKKHFMIVGGADWNNYKNLNNIPVIKDDRIIYTFHFYDPFVFTHQGATWVDPSMASLTNVPFPYQPGKMPTTPPSLEDKWPGNALANYEHGGTEKSVKQLIDIAVAFKDKRKATVFCGEFGVFIPNSNNADRVRWYKLVCDYLTEKEIPWTIWDYKGTFGLFKKGSAESFETDLNIPLLEALHFTIPAGYLK
jgi:endoglucanase